MVVSAGVETILTCTNFDILEAMLPVNMPPRLKKLFVKAVVKDLASQNKHIKESVMFESRDKIPAVVNKNIDALTPEEKQQRTKTLRNARARYIWKHRPSDLTKENYSAKAQEWRIKQESNLKNIPARYSQEAWAALSEEDKEEVKKKRSSVANEASDNPYALNF